VVGFAGVNASAGHALRYNAEEVIASAIASSGACLRIPDR
jgi:hypothetical protein